MYFFLFFEFQQNKQILIDAVVHAVNEDYAEMANDFTRLGFLASGTDVSPIIPALEAIWQNSVGKGLSDFNFRSVTGTASNPAVFNIVFSYNFLKRFFSHTTASLWLCIIYHLASAYLILDWTYIIILFPQWVNHLIRFDICECFICNNLSVLTDFCQKLLMQQQAIELSLSICQGRSIQCSLIGFLVLVFNVTTSY